MQKLLGTFIGWVVVALLAPLPCVGQGLADEDSLKAAGIRKLDGRHFVLFTDLPSEPNIDGLPAIFDQAVPQWARFFGFEATKLRDWKVVGCVMRDKQRFIDYGLLPTSVPEFKHGMQVGDYIWINEQPGPYYRRHLVLHEGSHAVVNRLFGRVGPVWYREGMAELLGTHCVIDGKLQLAHFPQNRAEVEHWGRIKLVNEAVRDGKGRSIPSIVNARTREFEDVQLYAWSWALTTFLRTHFPEALNLATKAMPRSTRRVSSSFLDEYFRRQQEFDVAWHLFLCHLDYGYDSSAEVIDIKPVQSLSTRSLVALVDCAKPWQSTGYQLPANARVTITANGRYQVGQDPKPWWCEPQGVTIEYYHQQPLGMLLAAVVEPDSPDGSAALARPVAIGRRGQLRTSTGGVLYLRLNERADRLGDNRGELTVKIRIDVASSADEGGL